MAANTLQANLDYSESDSDIDIEDDDSVASNETDDGQEHEPDKVLAEFTSRNDYVWYLIKWKDCSLLRSSWEDSGIFTLWPWALDAWLVEKQKHAEGKSHPLNITAFNQAVLEVEKAERQRRLLRRLKRRITRVLSIVDT